LSAITGTTFNLQQFSTEDGPGIRTTVFMKGCLLRCDWCHNPEGMHTAPDLVWYDVRCIAARDCLAACPENALELDPDGMHVDRQHCTVCGDCARACPSAALEVIGKSWTVEALLQEILKDQVFFDTSGGGVTFSGGEPGLQADFLSQLLPRCKASGLHVALDTCAALPWERYERLLPFVDLLLLDLKLMDSQAHRRATGMSNALILENARCFAEWGGPIWVRTPIIPGYSASIENLQAIGGFIQQELPNLERWDLLAYTNLGKPKYHRLDRPYALEDIPLLTRQEMEALWQAAIAIVPAAQWSGATRL
jgi:pyruvate formate lyase activating enzyme